MPVEILQGCEIQSVIPGARGEKSCAGGAETLDARGCARHARDMKARSSLGLLGVSSLLLVVGCVAPQPSSHEGPSGKAGQPIINGEPDVTHDAVMAVLGNTGACTGTVIAKDVVNKKGYVLTAAHCVSEAPQVVVRGTNYANGTQYPVVDYKAHESYDGQVYDFAMVTFTWNNNEPPVIPITTAAMDNMAAGTNVTFVGYGVTESNQNNSTRFFVDGQLAEVDPLTISYNQSNSGPYPNSGGPCFGDSGGPAFLDVPGVGETVAGITSYGDQNCTQFGVSGRTSAVEGWIADYITNGGGGGGQTCDQCFQASTSSGGACIGSVNECLNDQACVDFINCINDCQTQACVDTCVQQNPNGVDGYVAILACVCDTGCNAECGNEPFCQDPTGPTCGFESSDTTCQSCFETSCCGQATACAADNACYDCLTGANPDETCLETNGLAAQFYQCLAQKCDTECGVMGGGGAGGGGSAAAVSAAAASAAAAVMSAAPGWAVTARAAVTAAPVPATTTTTAPWRCARAAPPAASALATTAPPSRSARC